MINKLILAIAISILNTIFMMIYSTKYLQYFQLKNYKSKQYLRWLKMQKHMHIDGFCLCICFAIFMIFNLFCKYNLSFFLDKKTLFILPLFFLFIYFIFAYFHINNFPKRSKTPLVFTAKIKRLIFFELIFYFIFNLFSIYFFISNIIMRYIFIPIFFLSSSYFILLTNWCMMPLEKMIQAYYFFKSKRLLKQHSDCTIIAITGSVGKTSTKNILYHLLKDKFDVIKTPSSFNTPLGICKTINSKFHLFDHSNKAKIFIVEMGARHISDIKKLCKYVKPSMGIVTAILPQHIETFKNIDNVYLAKKQLPDFLNNNFCAFNADNTYCANMFEEKSGEKMLISTKKVAEFYAKNIEMKNCKTCFELCHDNMTYDCETELLGEKNVGNILLATSIAHKLGMKMEDICNNIKILPQTEHRLQLIKSPANFFILDDSYNCSIDSSRLALEVLKNFGGKKIVCTAGIIEGGNMQDDLNCELAEMIADVADEIIIVGYTNRKTFEAKFERQKKEKLFFVDSLEEAKKMFPKMLHANDCLLLLNDLPDDYD